MDFQSKEKVVAKAGESSNEPSSEYNLENENNTTKKKAKKKQ